MILKSFKGAVPLLNPPLHLLNGAHPLLNPRFKKIKINSRVLKGRMPFKTFALININ